MKLSFLKFLLKIESNIYIKSLRLIDFFAPKGACIYMFHDFSEKETFEKYTLSKNQFEDFIDRLISKGRTFVTIQDAITTNIKNKNAVSLTFDDVYENFYTIAYPILCNLNICFTLFISLEFINQPKYLNINQIKELSNNQLCTIASHGFKHEYFRLLSQNQIIDQLSSSKKYLEQLINQPINSFAFPYGTLFECALRHRKLVKKAGYKYGFSTVPTSLSISKLTSMFFLPRINVNFKLICRL